MQAVIFDMDGVILESEPLHDQAVRVVFAQQGYTASSDDLTQMMIDFRGRTDRDTWKYAKETFAIQEPIEQLLEWKATAFLRIVEDANIALMDGLSDVFTALLEKYPLALASSSPYSAINAIVDGLSIRDVFTHIVSGQDVESGKPAPDIFLLAASKLSVDPAECVVIEDSRNGVLAANAAGMRSIGYQGSPSNTQDLSEADTVIQHFNELLGVL